MVVESELRETNSTRFSFGDSEGLGGPSKSLEFIRATHARPRNHIQKSAAAIRKFVTAPRRGNRCGFDRFPGLPQTLKGTQFMPPSSCDFRCESHFGITSIGLRHGTFFPSSPSLGSSGKGHRQATTPPLITETQAYALPLAAAAPMQGGVRCLRPFSDSAKLTLQQKRR